MRIQAQLVLEPQGKLILSRGVGGGERAKRLGWAGSRLERCGGERRRGREGIPSSTVALGVDLHIRYATYTEREKKNAGWLQYGYPGLA